MIQIISLFNTSQSELKLLFSEIHNAWAKPFWGFLYDLLYKLSVPRDCPDDYFDFNGRDSVSF